VMQQIGKNTLPICQRYVDKVVTVSEHYIALAILRLVEMEKVTVPAIRRRKAARNALLT